MNKNLSTYLDLMRWLAAMGVFISHADIFILRWLPAGFGGHGSDFVAIFFVLSGFVIRHATQTRETNWRRYLTQRLARLYSVVPLAMLVTAAADHLGANADPALYGMLRYFNPSPSFGALAAYVTFNNQLWLSHVFVGSNLPYWSLGFEVPYYALFGVAMFTRGLTRGLLITLWLLMAGPKIAAYLPLWLIGVAAYECLRAKPQSGLVPGAALVSASIAVYLLGQMFRVDAGTLLIYAPSSYADLLKGAGYFSAIGLATALNIIGFTWLGGARYVWHPKLATTLRWLAGGSFTLYLTHQPLLIMVNAVCPGLPQHPWRGLAACACIFAGTLLLAECGERRKKIIQKGLEHFRLSTSFSEEKPAKKLL